MNKLTSEPLTWKIEEKTLEDFDYFWSVMKGLRGNITDRMAYDRLTKAFETGYVLYGAVDSHGHILGLIAGRILHDVFRGSGFYIDDLVVHKKYHGKGIGKALIDFIKSYAREKDCSHIRLCSSLQRLEAHRFYAKCHMEKCSFQFVHFFLS